MAKIISFQEKQNRVDRYLSNWRLERLFTLQSIKEIADFIGKPQGRGFDWFVSQRIDASNGRLRRLKPELYPSVKE